MMLVEELWRGVFSKGYKTTDLDRNVGSRVVKEDSAIFVGDIIAHMIRPLFMG